MNIGLLREEAQRLLLVEIELLEKMQNEPGVISEARTGEQQTFDRTSIPKHIEVLQGELAKLEGLEMVLAVVGTMKAGKSTTINAIVGTEVLPNRNRPMTALPTLIRHTPGQTEPLLKFNNSQPINDLISTLHKAIQSPESKGILQGLDSNPDMDELLSLIANQTLFKQTYQGADAIFGFLKNLNDLVRLSSELEVDFPFASYDEIHEMPVIEVEFAQLREMDQAQGRLTLLDTPGPNESGQQHLRKMLKEQLSKASAVLAVLDFTQLKSEADAEVRKELEEIASVAEGRLYTLVNKFDQKDRHGDNEEQVKAFVAESLMQGLIQKADVFPVSSRWGYLANRAKHEIFLHKKLPDPNRQPWVVDFAEEAFGRRWESKINDIEEVQHAAEQLWQDSLFSKPMENVIRSAHARAAAFAIDSAAAKLVDNAEKLENFLGLRETALAKSSRELQQQIDALMNDIGRIEGSEKVTQKQINDTLTSISESTSKVFEQIESNSFDSLNEYFKEGKRIERAQNIEKKSRRKKQSATSSKNTFAAFLPHFLKQPSPLTLGDHDFNPDNPIIRCESSKEAKNLMSRIEKSVASEMKHAENTMQEAMEALLNDFNVNFTSDVVTSAQKIVDDMKGRMTEDGFSVNIQIPNIKSVSLDFSADEMLQDIIQKKTEIVTYRRRQKGVWGGICKLFSTRDFGFEDYEEKEKYFEIDIRKVKETVTAGIARTFEGLGKSVAEYIEQPLKKGTAEFFNEFKSKVEQIRGDLLQSIRDQERSKSEQVALSKRLSSLKKNVPATLRDSRELKADVKSLLNANAQVLA
ncbi:MAG: dynamin family protein [Pseudomonas sp.]|nr:dynamin family protein [Pseudomonas sp.]